MVFENPLSIPVTFAAATNLPEIQMPDKIVLPPQSKVPFYFPLLIIFSVNLMCRLIFYMSFVNNDVDGIAVVVFAMS